MGTVIPKRVGLSYVRNVAGYERQSELLYTVAPGFPDFPH